MMDLSVPEIKRFIDELKGQMETIQQEDDGYNPDTDLLKATIDNIEEELVGVKDFNKTDIRKQARIAAFMTFIANILEEGLDDEDFDDEDDDLDFEDEDEEK